MDDTANILRAVAAVLLAVLGWVWLRLIGLTDSHERRIRNLEQDRVTKGDITAVYERIEDLSKQSNDQATAILGALARRSR